jgi:hypothetical protein
MGRAVIVGLVLLLAATPAHAQTRWTNAVVAQREAVHDQAVAATSLFVASTALATAAWIMAPLGLFIGASGPACAPMSSCSPDTGDEALLWGGVAVGGLSIVLLIIGAVVDTGRHRLAHTLSVSLAVSPSSLAITF